MTNRSFSWAVIAALLSVSTAGCKGKLNPERICEDGCDAAAACDNLVEGESKADCRSECEEQLEDADKDCRQAFRDFVDCYSSASCDDLDDECTSEAFGLFADCPDLLEDVE